MSAKMVIKTHFFEVLQKILFSDIFMLWGVKNKPEFFFKKQKNLPGPPLKNRDKPKFSLLSDPPKSLHNKRFY